MASCSAGRTALIISHVVPSLRAAGNEARILGLLTFLREEEHRIVMLFNAPSLPDPVKRDMARFADEVWTTTDLVAPVDPAVVGPVLAPYATSHPVKRGLCPPELVAQAHALGCRHRPDVVITEYVFTAPCLDVVPPGTLKCIDTHDMFSRRDPSEALCCTREEERTYLLKCDLVLAIQENEATLFRELVPEREVLVVGHHASATVRDANTAVKEGSVLIVGSDNEPNRLGLAAFCREAWPSILTRHPRATLRIVGRLGTGFTSPHPSIVPVGWVDDLPGEYSRAAVVINSTEIGTGLKIKTVEALSFGKAFVGTPNSVEGLPIASPEPFVACSDWQSFAEATSRLLASDEDRTVLEARARDYAERHLGRESAYGALRQKLAAVESRRH